MAACVGIRFVKIIDNSSCSRILNLRDQGSNHWERESRDNQKKSSDCVFKLLYYILCLDYNHSLHISRDNSLFLISPWWSLSDGGWSAASFCHTSASCIHYSFSISWWIIGLSTHCGLRLWSDQRCCMALGSGRFGHFGQGVARCCSTRGRFSEVFTGFAWGHRFLHVLYKAVRVTAPV